MTTIIGYAHLGTDGKILPAEYAGSGSSSDLQLLSTTTNINAKNVAITNLYTVPGGKKAYVFFLLVRGNNIDTVISTPTFSVGTNAVNYDNLQASTVYPSPGVATAQWDILVELNVTTAQIPYCTAGSIIKLNITTGYVATTAVWDVDVFGLLI